MDVESIKASLANGPRSSRELNVSAQDLRSLAAQGVISIDPDRWPNNYTPGNPLIARLPDDERPWPGWRHWNL